MVWDRGHPVYPLTTIARGGYTVAAMKNLVDADILGLDYRIDRVLVNLGANDVTAMPGQATWEANLAYILDAFRTKWPTVKVWIMRVWRRNELTDCNTLAGWIDNVISTRSTWAFVGPDERVFLEGGDDGVTLTSDGVHPNAAGQAETAKQWRTVIGW